MKDDIQCCAGISLSNEEREACISLIKEGGAVDPKNAEAELPLAKLVTIKRAGKNIVGVGAIKRCRPQYAYSIAEKSKFQFDPCSHEFGYVAIKESHRNQRLSHMITEKLLSKFQERPLFATTSNENMKRTLRKAGFVQRGEEWMGKKEQLSLWIKNGES